VRLLAFLASPGRQGFDPTIEMTSKELCEG
jgi:hypothetical protein